MIVQRTNEKQLRTLFYSLDRIKQAFSEESKIMTENCAKEFKLLLIQNIVNETFSGGYDPLSKRYVEWKQQQGAYSGFWKQWGDLVRAIWIRPTPKGFTVEVNRGAMPSRSSSWGSKKIITPVWKYAFYGEMGRKPGGFIRNGQPPRAVFKPSAEQYRVGFLDRRRRDALNKIRSKWGNG